MMKIYKCNSFDKEISEKEELLKTHTSDFARVGERKIHQHKKKNQTELIGIDLESKD